MVSTSTRSCLMESLVGCVSPLLSMSHVKVYTVNGAVAGSSSSIPDWLTRARTAKAKGKRALREHVQGQVELIQGFEFPEASNKIKSTRDGHHAIATGTYKPQMRVWDLDELTLKFERHGDAENVDFLVSPRPNKTFLRSSHPRSCPTTGPRRSTSKTTAPSHSTRRAASTTAPASRASAVRSRTTPPRATRSSPAQATRSTASTSHRAAS